MIHSRGSVHRSSETATNSRRWISTYAVVSSAETTSIEFSGGKLSKLPRTALQPWTMTWSCGITSFLMAFGTYCKWRKELVWAGCPRLHVWPPRGEPWEECAGSLHHSQPFHAFQAASRSRSLVAMLAGQFDASSSLDRSKPCPASRC